MLQRGLTNHKSEIVNKDLNPSVDSVVLKLYPRVDIKTEKRLQTQNVS